MPGPHQVSTGGIGQLGDNPEQFTVKIAGPVLIMTCLAANERHRRGIAACQPCRDISVVVEIDRGDLAGTDDLGFVVLGYPDIRRVHAGLLP
jgi:hypothetical protein